MSHQKGVLQAKGPGLGIVTAFGILDIEKAVPTDLAEDLGPNILEVLKTVVNHHIFGQFEKLTLCI
jgi:hypothetical protein